MSLEFVHISDLHFGHPTHSPKRSMTTPHDPSALRAFFNYLGTNPADAVFVTGDVATDGQESSLQNARHFLAGPQSDMWQQRVTQQCDQELLGLGIPAEKLVVVPGNHDRYMAGCMPLTASIRNYLSVFRGSESLPDRLRSSRWISANGLRLRVLCIDSCGGIGPCNVAAGRVHEDDLGWIQEKFEEDEVAEERWDLRILLVHHHVALPANRRFKMHSKLRNRDKLLHAMLRGGIDMVLFGHEHSHYVAMRSYRDVISDRRQHGSLVSEGLNLDKKLLVLMSGSTLQHGEPRNSAWRVSVARAVGDTFSLQLKLLEADSQACSFTPVSKESKEYLLKKAHHKVSDRLNPS